MATIRISAADAARDFAGLLAKVRAGAEVIIEDGANPPAILRSEFPAPRTISESIEIARRLQLETGEAPESRRVGFLEGKGDVGPEFFDPLPDDELRLWNGEGE
jgi:antitoxin (DNA-binding transcriptional repressor) of toxin-antitoxin stability system